MTPGNPPLENDAGGAWATPRTWTGRRHGGRLPRDLQAVPGDVCAVVRRGEAFPWPETVGGCPWLSLAVSIRPLLSRVQKSRALFGTNSGGISVLGPSSANAQRFYHPCSLSCGSALRVVLTEQVTARFLRHSALLLSPVLVLPGLAIEFEALAIVLLPAQRRLLPALFIRGIFHAPLDR